MTMQSLAGRSIALFASALTTITLLMATQVPAGQTDLAIVSDAGAAQLALPDDQEPCRFPRKTMGESFPCLPKPPRPATEAHG